MIMSSIVYLCILPNLNYPAKKEGKSKKKRRERRRKKGKGSGRKKRGRKEKGGGGKMGRWKEQNERWREVGRKGREAPWERNKMKKVESKKNK